MIYNPKEKQNVAYHINNNISKYVDASIFVNHNISVPIYNKKIIYGEENKTNTYKAKFSAPNMYDMFSAQSNESTDYASYSDWLTNSSKVSRLQGALYDKGVPLNEAIDPYAEFGIRVVGFIKSDSIVTNGDGTINSPYILK